MAEHAVEEYVWRFGDPPERSAKRDKPTGKKNYVMNLRI